MIDEVKFSNLTPVEYDKGLENFNLVTTPLDKNVKIDVQIIGSSTGASLISRYNSGSVLEEFQAPKDIFGLELPCYDKHSINTYVNHPEGHNQSFIISQGEYARWEIPDQATYQCIVMDTSCLSNLITPIEQEWLYHNRSTIKRRDFESTELFALSRYLKYIKGDTSRFEPNHISNILDSSTISLISKIQDNYSGIQPTINTRQKILNRSLDYISSQYMNNISVAEIACYSNTTTRNLQLVYKQRFGCSPMSVLKHYRYRQLAKELQQYSTVREAASRAGLHHMGRLNQEFESILSLKVNEMASRLSKINKLWINSN
ncbi:hypothetical protein OLMES_2866 [Oleiphilus messinensis]|uniref:HTH araC/xylS-type domain-containing protein n=1 Tax=Oleiphilus messinensis TaxID=141451 RepID=A0A1Y0IBZ2_9GAMM|nr:helix-turn-helix domain-containing protein [Oleiphilus messinensis]ARU56914.1 hypothetical protein OLMES_2866 [Oleiphilus messinensis]